jgi:hypothetical protein
MAALHRPVTAAGHSPEPAAGVGNATSPPPAHIAANADQRLLQTAALCYPKISLVTSAGASFSWVNWGEKHCIRIPVAFRLYLVKII